ncbi:MAG: glycosyltransferase family 4 protein [bacterium]
MIVYFFVFFLSLIITLLITPKVIEFCRRYGIVDNPDERRIHKEPVPRLGGVAVIISITFTVLILGILVLWFEPEFFKVKYFNYDFLQILGIIFSLFLISLVGLWDDTFGLSAKEKLLSQLLIGNVLYFTGSKISFLSGLPILGGGVWSEVFSYLLTVFWVVGLINAINLIDGMDGALSGIGGIIGFTLGVIAVIQGQTVLAVFAFALSGSLIGFLKYNFNPAKIFLGDTGSLFIGTFMSIFSLLGYFKKVTVISLLVPVIIFALPIIDTAWAIVRRIIKKRNIFHPDKEHIHHKLLDFGLNQRQAAILLYFITVFLSFVAVMLIK